MFSVLVDMKEYLRKVLTYWNLALYPGILRDKTMNDKSVYITNDDTLLEITISG